MAKKTTLTLAEPWRDPSGKVHAAGSKVSVEPDQAEHMVLSGLAK